VTDDLLEERSFVLPDEYEQMNWFEGFGRQIGPLYQTKPGIEPFRRAFLVSDHHLNGRGGCHGGMLMAFADMAFGHAITMKVHRYWATVRLLTDFASPANVGDWVEGSGEIVGENDDIFTVKGRIWSGDKTIMIGSGIFKALAERPA
jgi:acyl-coenzyme A thioesterase PaaI-like protein